MKAPTSPPASTHTHFGPLVPKIGGSEGGQHINTRFFISFASDILTSITGFIGLVVGLGVIFIGSCIGVFFLLRNRKHGGRTIRGKSGEVGVEAPLPPGAPRRRGTLFGWRSQNPKKAGFVRANAGEDEDEWDASDNLHTYGRESVQLERNYGLQQNVYDPYRDGRPTASQPVEDGRYDRSYASLGGMGASSTSSVRLVAAAGELDHNDLSGSKDRHQFNDPFETPSHSTYDMSHHPGGISEAHQTSSRPVPHGNDPRSSIDSATTITSLPGGTKFKEAL